jgi:hypothetical protein
LKEQFKGFYNTPSLFNESFYGLELFDRENIDVESFDISNIEILQQLPLGKRVEYFLEAIIENSSRYEKIIKNKQIIHNKETLGEIDFIIFDKKRNKYIHIELQYKFYVYDDSFENEIDRYVGPNRSDTLVKKLEKLKNKQFPLLFNKDTKAYLEGIDLENIEQKILFKGNIFLPRHLKHKEFKLINNDCIHGYYLSFKEFTKDTSFEQMEFFVPHRFDWLSDPKSNKKWESYEKAKEDLDFFININASPLVWSKKIQDGETIIERFFVTWW